MVLLRSRLYKKVVSIFTNLKLQYTRNSLNALPLAGNIQHDARLLLALHHPCRHVNSPSLRLAVVLLANTLSSRGGHLLAKLLWECYHKDAPFISVENILRTYAAFLVDCACFDDPIQGLRTTCDESLTPLQYLPSAITNHLNLPPTNSGGVRLFDYDDTLDVFTESLALNGTEPGAFLGWSTALSSDGNRLAISAPNANSDRGLVRVLWIDGLPVRRIGTLRPLDSDARLSSSSLFQDGSSDRYSGLVV